MARRDLLAAGQPGDFKGQSPLPSSSKQNFIARDGLIESLPSGWQAGDCAIECWTEVFDSTPDSVETQTAPLRTAALAAT